MTLYIQQQQQIEQHGEKIKVKLDFTTYIGRYTDQFERKPSESLKVFFLKYSKVF